MNTKSIVSRIRKELKRNGDISTQKDIQITLLKETLNTYFEAMGAYLQIDSHASLDRYNIVPGQPDLYCSADIHNSSFLRIDDIVLGYKFSNLWLFSGRAYFAVQNPYVFTKYTGDEPEIYDGIDFGKEENYQRPTIFSVGVKLNINIKD